MERMDSTCAIQGDTVIVFPTDLGECRWKEKEWKEVMANFIIIFSIARIRPVIPGTQHENSSDIYGMMECHLLRRSLAVFQTLETWQEQREAGWEMGNHRWGSCLKLAHKISGDLRALGCSRSTAVSIVPADRVGRFLNAMNCQNQESVSSF